MEKQTFLQKVGGAKNAHRLTEYFFDRLTFRQIIKKMPKASFTIGRLAGIRRDHKKEIETLLVAYIVQYGPQGRPDRIQKSTQKKAEGIVGKRVKKIQLKPAGAPKRVGSSAAPALAKPVPAAPLPAVVARPVELPKKGAVITMLTVSDKTCRWPIGDVGEKEFHFCGKEPMKGRPYCEAHMRKGHVPQYARKPQPANMRAARIGIGK